MWKKTIPGADITSGFPENYSLIKLLVFSLLSAVFVLYPNIAFFTMERNYLGPEKYAAHLFFFIFRYIFFSLLIWILIIYNLRILKTPSPGIRFFYSLLATTAGYIVYVGFSLLLSPKQEWFSGILLFQFLVMFLFCAMIGHVSYLYKEQRRKEQEIEKLKIENLQSRYAALSNQINPHFFFNSLNGLASVIRKKDEENAIEYLNKLSDVFRYILQSDRKGMVTLQEELEFVKAFRYMMEIRFASKLVFNIDISDDMEELKLPVLSLLPLIENVVLHNTIDSEHPMEVNIYLNTQGELVVSNPVYPKLSPPETNGTGLINLENRFLLLMNKHIRVENDGRRFTVYLPLKNNNNEDTDS